MGDLLAEMEHFNHKYVSLVCNHPKMHCCVIVTLFVTIEGGGTFLWSQKPRTDKQNTGWREGLSYFLVVLLPIVASPKVKGIQLVAICSLATRYHSILHTGLLKNLY